MVLGVRVGKKRSFWRGFLLTLGTVGFYGVYWNYKAHDEMYKQFELQRENRDEGVIWLILGLIFPPLVFAYLWIFASNVAYVRERLRLARRTTPGVFVGLVGSALGTLLVAWLAFVVVLTVAEEVTTPEEATSSELLDAIGFFFFVGLVVFVVVAAFAYRMLQRDINEVWEAYDRRVQELISAPPVGALLVLPPLPERPTTWSQLAPPQTAQPGEPSQRRPPE